jgi:hypothetical protein
MPSVSKKQHNLMAAVAKNPAFAKKVGIKQSVGQDFLNADKGKKFGGGGMAKKLFGGKETYSEEMKEAKAVKSGKISPANFVQGEKSEGHKEEKSGKLAMAIKTGKMSPAKYASMESKEPKGMKSGGIFRKSANGIAQKGLTKGTMVSMKKGGAC